MAILNSSFLSLLIIITKLSTHSKGQLKLRKCCPKDQQLFLDSSDHMECTKLRLDSTEANSSTGGIWWMPDNLNLIETTPSGGAVESDVKLIDMDLSAEDFIYQGISCLAHSPELVLIQSNVFLDVNNSQLVLAQAQSVPEYATEFLNDTNDSVEEETSPKQTLTPSGDGDQLDEEINKQTTTQRSRHLRETLDSIEIIRKGEGTTRIKTNSRHRNDDFCIDRVTYTAEDEGTREEGGDSNSTIPNSEDESPPNAYNHVILLCPCQTPNTVCVRKCCAENKLLHVMDSDDRNAYCVDHEPRQQEQFDAHVYTSEQEPPQRLHNVPHYILHGTPQCQHGSYLLRNNTTSFRDKTSDPSNGWKPPDAPNWTAKTSFKILRNSTVLLTESRALADTSEYCVDSIYYGASRLRIDGNILLCRQEESPHVDRMRRTIYTICFIVGTGFLILTLAVYALLPDLRKSVHSWNIMAHIACSVVAYTAIVIANLYTIAYPTLCILMAYVLQISFLSSQLWLNAMCIDIACTFSGLRAPGGRDFTSIDRTKFLYYSAYTWGTTALISGLTYAADTSGVLAANSALKPNFGVKACWFKESTSIAIFFYGPIGLLLVANLVLFHYTCFKIRAAQKDTAITAANRHMGGRAEDQTQLTTFIKLFLLMGVTWTFEIVSWVLGGPHYLWYLTDLLNVLRGVFIFIILCCKRNILAMMHRRLRQGQRRMGAAGPRPRTESNTSRRTSKSSMSTEHVGLSRLNLSSTPNLITIHQGRILEEKEVGAPSLSVVPEVGEEREGKG